MLLPKRHASDESYRYGFQGQEKDDELKGEGNSLNFKFRMHDPRLGRFFAIDPLAPKYPHYTPYQFAGNKVIQAAELEGLEEEYKYNAYFAAEEMVNALDNGSSREEAKKVYWQTINVLGGFSGSGNSNPIGDFLYYGSESAIDGVVFSFTTLFGGIAVNIDRGIFGKRRVWHNHIQWGYSHTELLKQDGYSSGLGNTSPEDAMRIFNGVTTVTSIGEITVVVKPSLKQAIRQTTNIVFKRKKLAKAFYAKAGFDDLRAADHITGINFSRSVMTKTYKKGTVLEQWTYLDDLGNPKIGDYFTLPGADPTKLGIPLKGRVKTTVELLEDTKFLKSTTNKIEDWTNPGNMLNGGETQLFSTNVKSKVINSGG